MGRSEMNFDPNNIFGSITFNNVILWLLSVATLIFILDVIGLLPPWVAKWLAQNRLDVTIRALKSLGVKITWDGDKMPRPSFLSRTIDSLQGKEAEYKVLLRSMLEQHTLQVPVHVGLRRTFALDSFIDVIGGTTDPVMARQYARILYTHLDAEGLLDFDFVATPKDGSPLLGYEFAIISGKPLVLGVCSKGSHSKGQMHSHLILDYPHDISLKERTGILVDDSTTGGRKMLDLANALRTEGATISNAAVLFEPIGKGARALLKTNKLELNSRVLGPTGRS